MKKIWMPAFIMLSLVGPVQADVKPVKRGGMCFTDHASISSAKVVWKCEHIGQATIKEIYERGFRVVNAYTTDPSDAKFQFQYLVIEEQQG